MKKYTTGALVLMAACSMLLQPAFADTAAPKAKSAAVTVVKTVVRVPFRVAAFTLKLLGNVTSATARTAADIADSLL